MAALALARAATARSSRRLRTTCSARSPSRDGPHVVHVVGARAAKDNLHRLRRADIFSTRAGTVTRSRTSRHASRMPSSGITTREDDTVRVEETSRRAAISSPRWEHRAPLLSRTIEPTRPRPGDSVRRAQPSRVPQQQVGADPAIIAIIMLNKSRKQVVGVPGGLDFPAAAARPMISSFP